jgi:hypothetical protein
MSLNNAYCVCTVPGTYHSYVKHWDSFKETGRQLTFVSDISSDGSFDVGFLYNETNIRMSLNFYKDVDKRNFWNSVGNRNIVWFYAHFRMLNYYIHNPHYENYWFFDDDVRMDDWNAFFNGVDNDDSDFMSYFCFKNKNVESQLLIPKIDSNTHSCDAWFLRFPGPGDVVPEDVKEVFGSFFPVVKFSNRAMKKLLDLNNEGLSGYSEGFVPTMLNKHGMKLNTLIKSDDTSDFFDVNEVNIKHKNIKIEWSWI